MLAKFVRPIVYIYHRFDAFKDFLNSIGRRKIYARN